MKTHHTQLEKRDPRRNQARFYALWIVPTLFGHWSLLREWGRIGSPGRIVVDGFETVDAASSAFDKKVSQKLKRGYAARLWE